jgi:hypothetical protein
MDGDGGRAPGMYIRGIIGLAAAAAAAAAADDIP